MPNAYVSFKSFPYSHVHLTLVKSHLSRVNNRLPDFLSSSGFSLSRDFLLLLHVGCDYFFHCFAIHILAKYFLPNWIFSVQYRHSLAFILKCSNVRLVLQSVLVRILLEFSVWALGESSWAPGA